MIKYYSTISSQRVTLPVYKLILKNKLLAKETIESLDNEIRIKQNQLNNINNKINNAQIQNFF